MFIVCVPFVSWNRGDETVFRTGQQGRGGGSLLRDRVFLRSDSKNSSEYSTRGAEVTRMQFVMLPPWGNISPLEQGIPEYLHYCGRRRVKEHGKNSLVSDY
jgi:hypothetical protein